MKIVICGAGLVGTSIASHLAEEQNDVTVVDASAEKIQRLTEQVDVHGVVGVASYPDILSGAGARDAGGHGDLRVAREARASTL